MHINTYKADVSSPSSRRPRAGRRDQRRAPRRSPRRRRRPVRACVYGGFGHWVARFYFLPRMTREGRFYWLLCAPVRLTSQPNPTHRAAIGPQPQAPAPGAMQPPADLSTLSEEERAFWEKKAKIDALRAKEVFETTASFMFVCCWMSGAWGAWGLLGGRVISVGVSWARDCPDSSTHRHR